VIWSNSKILGLKEKNPSDLDSYCHFDTTIHDPFDQLSGPTFATFPANAYIDNPASLRSGSQSLWLGLPLVP